MIRPLQFLLCVAALLVALATPAARAQNAPPPLATPGARLQLQGYALTVPNEPGWRIGRMQGPLLILGKLGARPDESTIILGSLVRLQPFRTPEELARQVAEEQAADDDPARFVRLEQSVTPVRFKGTDCVRSYYRAEDRAARKHSARPDPMILEVLSLTCAHPENAAVGVNVGYSHRSYAEDRDPDFTGHATPVLESLEFGELPAGARSP